MTSSQERTEAWAARILSEGNSSMNTSGPLPWRGGATAAYPANLSGANTPRDTSLGATEMHADPNRSASAAHSFLERTNLEAYMRSHYDHRLRVATAAILHSLSEELPHDHILLQLFADEHTSDYVKLRVSEVVDATLHSSLSNAYNSLIAELSRKEMENVQLRHQLDAMAAQFESDQQFAQQSSSRVASVSPEATQAVHQETVAAVDRLQDALQQERERGDRHERRVVALQDELLAKEAEIAKLLEDAKLATLKAEEYHGKIGGLVEEHRKKHDAQRGELQERVEVLQNAVNSCLSEVALSHESKAKERSILAVAQRMVRTLETHAQKPHELVDELCLLAFSAVSASLSVFAERGKAVDNFVASLPQDAGVSAASLSGSPQQSARTPSPARGSAISDATSPGSPPQFAPFAGWSFGEKKQLLMTNVKDVSACELVAQQLIDGRPAVVEAAGEVRQGVQLLRGLSNEHEALKTEAKSLMVDTQESQKTAVAERVALQKDVDRLQLQVEEERSRHAQLREAHELLLAAQKREGDENLVEGVAAAAAAKVNNVVEQFDGHMRDMITDYQQELERRDAGRQSELMDVISALQSRQESFEQRQAQAVEAPVKALLEGQQLAAVAEQAKAEEEQRVVEIQRAEATTATENTKKAMGVLMASLGGASSGENDSSATAVAGPAGIELTPPRQQKATAGAVSADLNQSHNTPRSGAVGLNTTHASELSEDPFAAVIAMATNVSAQVGRLQRENAVLKHILSEVRVASVPRLHRSAALVRELAAGLETEFTRQIELTKTCFEAVVGGIIADCGARTAGTFVGACSIIEELVDHIDSAFPTTDESGSPRRSKLREDLADFTNRAQDRRAGGYNATMVDGYLRELRALSRSAVRASTEAAQQQHSNALNKLFNMSNSNSKTFEDTVAELRAAKAAADVASASAASQMEKAKDMVANSDANRRDEAATAEAMAQLFAEKASAEEEVLRLRQELFSQKAQADAAWMNLDADLENLKRKLSDTNKQLLSEERKNGVLHERCSVKENENVRLSSLLKQQNTSLFNTSNSSLSASPAVDFRSGSRGVSMRTSSPSPSSTVPDRTLGNYMSSSPAAASPKEVVRVAPPAERSSQGTRSPRSLHD